MARTTTLTDDMDGSPDASERAFSIGGTDYTIDLADHNFELFLKLVEPYRSRSRVARKTRTNKAPVLTKDDRAAIRKWAEERGKVLAPRGRFPNDLVNEYYLDQYGTRFVGVNKG